MFDRLIAAQFDHWGEISSDFKPWKSAGTDWTEFNVGNVSMDSAAV